MHRNIQKFEQKTQNKISWNLTSIAKITCFDDAFLGLFEWEARPVEGQSLYQKDNKRRKRKGKKKLKNEKPKDIGHFLIQNFEEHSYAKERTTTTTSFTLILER